MSKNAIYRTDSENEIYTLLAGRIIFLAGIIGALWNIKENPVGLSILVVILALVFLLSGHESIIVYNDRVVFDEGGIIRIFKKKVYYYKDIKEVRFEPISGLDLTITNYFTKTPENTIQITFRNDNVETISTKLPPDDMDKTVGIIEFELQRYLRK
jgi:hypothetical protein